MRAKQRPHLRGNNALLRDSQGSEHSNTEILEKATRELQQSIHSRVDPAGHPRVKTPGEFG